MSIKYKILANSSNVLGYFYDAGKKELYIKFKNQSEYKYFDVTAADFAQLFEEGKSFGKQLSSVVIKQKKYEEVWE